MNFFEQQDHARRQSRTLLLLFMLAVIAIVVAVNVAMALISIWMQGQPLSGHHSYPKGFFLANTFITLALIVGGTMIELFNLRDGGDVVARMAGGRMVSPDTRDTSERRLFNVVEEMALASGIACPKVYVLDREDGINAFAAGYNASEAVVAVTRGALGRLTRDELQGVIAHEFSHILNGDMRLNLRLIGVLFGIQMIAGFGQHLMDFGVRPSNSDERDDRAPPFHFVLLAVGGALYVIGYIGIFFGRLIKSAVSRQREFLADASAVQFTRNPDGIGQALRKIGGFSRAGGGGSRIRHPNAEQLSHLFLSAVRPNLTAGLFATHPSIRERLHRIYGRDVGLLDAPEIAPERYADIDAATDRLPDIPYMATSFPNVHDDLQAAAESIQGANATAHMVKTSGNDPLRQIRLAPAIDQAMHDPHAATALVYALLLNGDQDARKQTLATQLTQHLTQQQLTQIEQLTTAIGQLPRNARLPLLDLSMPALRQLPAANRAAMLSHVDRLIAADHRVTLYEFVLQTVLARRLDPHAGRAIPVRFFSLAELKRECADLFSLAAHVAAPLANQSATVLFMRAAASCPQLGFAETDLVDATVLGFGKVRAALDSANQLAPLAKPALIKALTGIIADRMPMPVIMADLLHAICAAIEAPMPPSVAAVYATAGWTAVE